MSFEPDDEATVLRQLREEIAKIREENFATTLPTNNIGASSPLGGRMGTPLPAIGTASIVPETIFTTKDTGVIDLLKFDGKNLNKDFEIGETITGQSSGATAEVGDIDTLTDTTGVLTLVPSTIVGTFNDNENLNGSGAGGNNIADADGSQFTQTGRGHLVAGAGSVIASAENVSAPFEIHFIDNAGNDGQTIYIRAGDGQTIRMRRAVTKDTTTGNLDLNESFDIIENGIVFFQFQVASDVSEFGGWVPQISDVTQGVGTGGGAFQFPILYPKENLGTQNGVINLSLTQQDGHYKQVTLDGDASITFSNLPPAINGFKFYLLTIQDGIGGHVYTDLPNTVLFEGSLLGQLQTAPNSQTLWQFSTADGGTNWHASVINPQGAGGSNQTPWLSDIDANTFNLFNLDVLRYANGLAPGADGVIGFNTYGSAVENDTKMKWSIPQSTLGNPRFYEWQVDLAPIMQLTRDSFGDVKLEMLEGSVENTSGISFFHPLGALSSITPLNLELKYDNGFGPAQGGFHGFHIAGSINAQFEIRENIIRANRDLDMITNDILEIDRARFDQSGGFFSIADKDDRLISGGAEGMVLNIPKITPFAGGFHLYFENNAETESEKQYSFEIGQFRMFSNFVSDTLGILFSNGGSISDLNTHIQFDGGVNSNAIDPQTIKFGVKDSGFTTKDMFELTGTEDGPAGVGGGMKMFTDLNMQTQNIHNIDVATWEPDVGLGIAGLANGSYGITADHSGFQTALEQFVFSIPLTSDRFSFQQGTNQNIAMNLTFNSVGGAPRLRLENFAGDTSVEASQWLFTNDYSLGTAGMVDGFMRLVGGDIIVGTGGGLVNLSTGAGGTSFIGFNADDDLRMNTFNITGVDVLRFQVDGGVIGFGEYGISADPTDFSMNFSVPLDRGYFFQNNLEGIAFLDHTGLNLLANTSFADPTLTARQFILGGLHTGGTSGMPDGSFRLVDVGGSLDVFVKSGGSPINLTTLGAGGGDNLGNHITTQNLDMNSVLQNSIINFTSLTSFLGHDWFFTTSGMTWNVDQSTDFYRWSFNNVPHMELSTSDLNVGNKQITNVLDPLNNLDAVNLQTLNAGLAGSSASLWSTFPALQAVNMDDFSFTNFVGWTAGIGQAFSVNPTNFSWSLNSSTHFYEWKLAGFPEMQLGQADLNMFTKQITNVIDPLNPQDVATKNYVDTTGGGDASAWSTFPATQQVNMDGNNLNNVTAVGIELGGGIIWDFPSGATMLADVDSLDINMFLLDAINFTFGGLTKYSFFTDGASFNSGNLNMNGGALGGNRIVNVTDPEFPQEVATKNYVDTVAVPGGSLLPLNNVWTGINAFTGTVHSITSPFTFIGDQTTDQITLTGQVDVPDFMLVQHLEVGLLDLFGELDMQGFRILQLDFPINPLDATNKAYVDGVAGGGVTLSGNNTWTGINTFTGTSHNITSPFTIIGDQFSDDVNIIGRIDFPLIPKFDTDIDLGTPFNRWRDLNVEFIQVASTGGINANGFSAFSDGLLVTGSDLVVTGSAVFTGATLPQGTFFHSGANLGFFGAGLTTRNTVFDVTATGNPGTDALLAIGAVNSLMFALEEYGLINVL